LDKQLRIKISGNDERIVQTSFYDNCKNYRAVIGLFSLSISGQTNEFIIYARRPGARADYRKNKKQIELIFSCVFPVIDIEFRLNIVKVVCGPTHK